MICVAASKKKNLETVKVLTTMTKLAAMTASRLVMFIARITFRMIKPGPARVLLVMTIFGERFVLRKLTVFAKSGHR